MMPWALLGIFIFCLTLSYIIVQGTRAALAWRKAAARRAAISKPNKQAN